MRQECRFGHDRDESKKGKGGEKSQLEVDYLLRPFTYGFNSWTLYVKKYFLRGNTSLY